MASEYVPYPSPEGKAQPYEADDDDWQFAPLQASDECLASATADLAEEGLESFMAVRDCGNDGCNACTKARNARMETEVMENLTSKEFDTALNKLSEDSDPMTFPHKFQDREFVPLDCDTDINQLINDWVEEHPNPEQPKECDIFCDHQAAPCPYSPYAAGLASIDEVLAGAATQFEPSWSAMQVEFENMPTASELGWDVVDINEPQAGLAEIQEAHEIGYVRAGKAMAVKISK